jgi:phosphate-selective porin OprO and OprP
MIIVLSSSVIASSIQDLSFKSDLFKKSEYLPRNSRHSFVKESSDKRYALYFNGIIDWRVDSFFNTKGIVMNVGTKGIPLLSQNTVTRNWLYITSPAFEAKIDENLHFYATPDFGQQQFRIFDVLSDINYFQSFSLIAGLQKSLVAGLDVLVGGYKFFNYTGFTSNMAPNREIGLTLYGTFGPHRATEYSPYHMYGFDDWFSYQLAVTNGNADATFPGLVPFFVSNTFNLYQSDTYNIGNKAFEGRAFLMPMIHHPESIFENIGFGFAGSAATVVNQIGLPAYLSIAKNAIFQYGGLETFAIAQGTRNRLHPQWVWFKNQWGLFGDYVMSLQHLALGFRSHVLDSAGDVITQNNHVFEIQYLYNLTGEPFTMGLMKPNNKFKPLDMHQLGGFQLGFRYSLMDLDPSVFQASYINSIGQTQYYYADPRVSVQKASAFSVILNWYWNQNFLIGTEFSYTKFKGGCSTGAYNDPYTPGCQTANNFYIAQPGSQVIDRPAETVIFQRMAFIF